MGDLASIHIVDDDPEMLRNLEAFATSAGYATECYGSAEELLRVAQRLAPGAIVTDVHLPKMSGIELIARLRQEAPQHPVILISGLADTPSVVEAMRRGAADFLEKPFRAAHFIETIQRALESEAADRARGHEATACRTVFRSLTPRQRDVLAGILKGQLNKTIAHELGISARTVETHRADMMMKTGAGGASALVRMAVLAGL
jgi:FixJ family two-component response regulator